LWYEKRLHSYASILRVKMEAAKSSAMLVSYRNTARRHNQEDLDLNLHHREKLKSLIWYRKITSEIFKCVAMKYSDVSTSCSCVNTMGTD
jgi:hypothetical protein